MNHGEQIVPHRVEIHRLAEPVGERGLCLMPLAHAAFERNGRVCP